MIASTSSRSSSFVVCHLGHHFLHIASRLLPCLPVTRYAQSHCLLFTCVLVDSGMPKNAMSVFIDLQSRYYRMAALQFQCLANLLAASSSWHDIPDPEAAWNKVVNLVRDTSMQYACTLLMQVFCFPCLCFYLPLCLLSTLSS